MSLTPEMTFSEGRYYEEELNKFRNKSTHNKSVVFIRTSKNLTDRLVNVRFIMIIKMNILSWQLSSRRFLHCNIPQKGENLVANLISEIYLQLVRSNKSYIWLSASV